MINFEELWLRIYPMLFALLTLVGLDFVLGVLIAIKQKAFDWSRLADYLGNSGLPIAGWLAAEVLLAIPQELVPDGVITGALAGVYATVFLKFLTSLLGHLSAIGLLTDAFAKLGVKATNHNGN